MSRGDPSLLSAGDRIDRWIVDAQLGSGAMARVYAVHHSVLDKRAAIKLLRTTHADVQRRLVREGRVQSNLAHPNIIDVDDVFVYEERPALVMELAEGPTLHRFLQMHQCSVDEALELFACILDAVRHAHANGVLHRDLKPANIILHVSDDAVVPKVADFGLAKLTEVPIGDATTAGIALGTPRYMAPEQAANAKGVDERADLFSLGCVLYELVCHKRTFGDDKTTVHQRMRDGVYDRPSQLVPTLPPHVASAIDKCVDPNPDERPGSCEELARMLFADRTELPNLVSADTEVARVTRQWQLVRVLESEGSAPETRAEAEMLEDLKNQHTQSEAVSEQESRMALFTGLVAGLLFVFALAVAFLLGGALF